MPSRPTTKRRQLPAPATNPRSALSVEGSHRGQPVTLEFLPFPAVLLDKSGAIQDANPLFCSLTTLSRETLSGRLITSLFMPRHRRRLSLLVKDAGPDSSGEGEDFSILTGEGSAIPVRLWLKAASRGPATPTGTILLVQDVTLQHRDFRQMEIYAGELRELYNRTKDQLAELTILNNIGALINTSIDTQEVVRTTIEGLRRIPWARAATIAVTYFDGASQEWCVFTLQPQGLEEQRISKEVLPERALVELFGRRRCLIFPDITSVPRPSAESLRPLLPPGEVRGLIVLPLVAVSRVFGAIQVTSQAPLDVSSINRRLLRDLGNQVSMAVHHSLLYQESDKRGSQTMQLLKALHLLASSLNLSTVLEQLRAQAASLVSGVANSVAIALSNDTEGQFRVVSFQSDNGKLSTPGLLITIPPAWGAAQGLVVVPDVKAALPELQDCLPSVVDLAALLVPIFLGNGLLGFILVFCPKGTTLSAEQEKLLGGLADYASVAIDNAQRYALERERAVRIEQLEQAKAELLASLAHELKTPLTSMTAAVDLLGFFFDSSRDSSQSSEDTARLLASLSRSAERLDGVVNGMLNATGSFLSLPGLNFQVLDILDGVENATRIMAPLFLARQQRFDLERPASLPILLADLQAIQQILINLLSNASKFAPPNTAITLNIQCSKGWLECCVKDQGPGVPKQAQESIFQGQRVSVPGLEAPVGRGLGLRTAKALVELHGGKMWVRSQPGKGSQFHFTLPLGGHYEGPGSGRRPGNPRDPWNNLQYEVA